MNLPINEAIDSTEAKELREAADEAVQQFDGEIIEEYNPDETFAGTETYEPKMITDDDKPVIKTGVYKCELLSITRRWGISKAKGKPYDGITIKAKIICDEDGIDTFKNLRVEQFFYLMESKFNDFKTGEEIVKTKEMQVQAFKDSMATAGLDIDYTNNITMKASFDNYENGGTEIWMKVKVKKRGGEIQRDDNGWPLYNSKIVREPLTLSTTMEEPSISDELSPF